MLSVPLRFIAQETPVRRGEPVTVGLPWPRGAVKEDQQFRLITPDGNEAPLQTRVLDRWPDGSIRWCLFDFLATVDSANAGYRIETSERKPAQTTSVLTDLRETTVDRLFHGLRVETTAGTYSGEGAISTETECGPIRNQFYTSTVRADTLDRLLAFASVDVFHSIPVIRVSLTLRNPRCSDHPGGNWDLGNHGSIFVKRLSITYHRTEKSTATKYQISVERGKPFQEVAQPIIIRQYGSGGDNWQGKNHLNKDHKMPLERNGYEFVGGNVPQSTGLRATPILVESGSRAELGIAMPTFWENFPLAISANESGLELELLSNSELQGGEQKTFTFFVSLGPDSVTTDPLVWCRSPLICYADPEWYAKSGTIPYLVPKSTDPNKGYLALVDQAIEGSDTFFTKRETIDEYGWRHFGDIYGDHESVDWPGPEPMVSHYNNQYDCVGGFLYQYLRSGDRRWWDLAIPCANHTCDIDIYHTNGDKAAYNRGLFWHTYHYAPADTGTHRSYPKSLRAGPQGSLTQKMDQLGETAAKLKKAYAVGGGPAASHNYNYGLMLAYFLTGNPIYRETAIDLAKFVIAMEDPAKTPFRWLSFEFTGLATESGGGGYHGPGRASGNSVNALLVGHQLSGNRAFLEKAEAIIRRVSHPKQNLDRLDLLNAELRWFYTMFLQSLGKYLDYKIELGELDRMYAFGRLTLSHYARWMALNERPILDTPDNLQYPTETWAAQDMRKVEVFQYAAKHASGEERAKYHERAEWFFRYVERTLSGFPTKSLCRPVVLMLNIGWSRAWWQTNSNASAPEPFVKIGADEFGEWRMFVPQKVIAMKRAKIIAVAGALGFAMAIAAGTLLLIVQ